MPNPVFKFQAFGSNLSRTAVKQDYVDRYAAADVVATVGTFTGFDQPTFPGTTEQNQFTLRTIRQNDLVHVWFAVKIGAGFTAGMSPLRWRLDLPHEALYENPPTGPQTAAILPIGRWRAERTSTAQVRVGDVVTDTSLTCAFTVVTTADNFVTADYPWVWAVNDFFSGHFCYVASPLA